MAVQDHQAHFFRGRKCHQFLKHPAGQRVVHGQHAGNLRIYLFNHMLSEHLRKSSAPVIIDKRNKAIYIDAFFFPQGRNGTKPVRYLQRSDFLPLAVVDFISNERHDRSVRVILLLSISHGSQLFLNRFIPFITVQGTAKKNNLLIMHILLPLCYFQSPFTMSGQP